MKFKAMSLQEKRETLEKAVIFCRYGCYDIKKAKEAVQSLNTCSKQLGLSIYFVSKILREAHMRSSNDPDEVAEAAKVDASRELKRL